MKYYNIPSNNRELQHIGVLGFRALDYNIPSNNRELQHLVDSAILFFIITYQVITGNYSQRTTELHRTVIITYQVITGNYSELHTGEFLPEL